MPDNTYRSKVGSARQSNTRYLVYGCMKLPVYTAEGQCTCTAGLCNCHVHFPDPGQIRFLKSGKAVAQKAGLACWIGPFVKFGRDFCLST